MKEKQQSLMDMLYAGDSSANAAAMQAEAVSMRETAAAMETEAAAMKAEAVAMQNDATHDGARPNAPEHEAAARTDNTEAVPAADAQTDNAEADAQTDNAEADAQADNTEADADAQADNTEADADAQADNAEAAAAQADNAEAVPADAQADNTEADADAQTDNAEADADAQADNAEAAADARADSAEADAQTKSATSEPEPRTIRLRLPATPEELLALRAGDTVYLSGEIYTARDAAHKRLCALLTAGAELPLDLRGIVIYYAGPCPRKPGQVWNSCGPTTSSRMDKFAPIIYENGAKGAIGKGEIAGEVIEAMKKHGAVYFVATGGAGALISKCVIAAQEVAFPELGAEAINRLIVREMPVIVGVDAHGADVFATAR